MKSHQHSKHVTYTQEDEHYFECTNKIEQNQYISVYVCVQLKIFNVLYVILAIQ